jgi:hypothetical protein
MLLPTGTIIYLTKKPHQGLIDLTHLRGKQSPYEFLIRPGRSFHDTTLYVAYDVKVGPHVVIPRGSRVTGEWVTELTTFTTSLAQLQVRSVIIDGDESPLFAHSDPATYTAIDIYNGDEVNFASHLYKVRNYKSVANMTRRLVKVNCTDKVLLDDDLDTVYLRIPTREIQVRLSHDF